MLYRSAPGHRSTRCTGERETKISEYITRHNLGVVWNEEFTDKLPKKKVFYFLECIFFPTFEEWFWETPSSRSVCSLTCLKDQPPPCISSSSGEGSPSLPLPPSHCAPPLTNPWALAEPATATTGHATLNNHEYVICWTSVQPAQ